jgi:aquaporin Z
MKIDNKTYRLFLSELVGTALLLAVGLSVVILCWGEGSSIAKLIPGHALRRAVTGFLFGCTGCLVTLSPVGKISGAHINPAVSLAFWLRGKMRTGSMLLYIIGQSIGAVIGCLPLLLWGNQGRSVDYGNTVPGNAGIPAAFVGEVVSTACLIVVIYTFVGSKKLKVYTPFTMPFLYCLLVWAESPYSGCSTNPARSFGPAVISNIYTANWLYWVAPATGVFLITAIFYWLNLHRKAPIQKARVSYHNMPGPAR